MRHRFVSEPIEPCAPSGTDLPPAFRWNGETLEVRHWYEFETADRRIATVYFDRGAKRGSPRWWLYAITPG
jgi:hypothetical protein